MPQPPLNVRVTIEPNGSGGYRATIADADDKPTVRPARTINWFFDAPADFPRGSVLYIRFFKKNLIFQKVDDRGCMQGSAWRDGIGEAEPDGRAIFGKVRNNAKGSHPYEVKYRLLAGGDHVLLDPEIIVEGSPVPTPDDKDKDQGGKKGAKRRARKAGKARKSKTAKKAKKARPAKRATRAKKAKKAKRTTKRKAKKR